MADVFLSFSDKDRPLAQRTFDALESHGYDIWSWLNKVPGDQALTAQVQDEAKATVVIWTPNSIQSELVRAEALRALEQGRLVPLKTSELPYTSIPAPFGGSVIVGDVEDHAALFDALDKKGITAKGLRARVAAAVLPNWLRKKRWSISMVLLVFAAVLIVQGILQGMGRDLWTIIKPFIPSALRW